MPGFDLMRCVRDKTCFRSSFSARILTLTLVLLVLFAQVRARDCVGKLTVEEVKGGGMLDKREGMCEERCGHSTWSIQNWVFSVFISFLPPPPHTIRNSPDSLETRRILSQDALLTFPPICSCRHSFLERQHCHSYSRAAAAENAGDAQVRASVRNCCNIMRPDSSPRWWRHYRQGWGSWRGGYGHQLHSAAIGALAVPRFLAIEGAHPRASVVAPPVRL